MRLVIGGKLVRKEGVSREEVAGRVAFALGGKSLKPWSVTIGHDAFCTQKRIEPHFQPPLIRLKNDLEPKVSNHSPSGH